MTATEGCDVDAEDNCEMTQEFMDWLQSEESGIYWNEPNRSIMGERGTNWNYICDP